MSSISKLFATDADKEVNGVVVEYRAVGGSIKVRISRAAGERNIEFAKCLQAKTKPYARAIANECMPPEVMKQVMAEAVAEKIVMEWDNKDDDGADIPCTPANVLKEFEESPDFLLFVIQEAQKLANFRKQYVDDAVKN